jgi:hypothetical protein
MDQLGRAETYLPVDLPNGIPHRQPPKRIRKPRVGKRDVMRRLLEENTDLRRMITILNQKISTVETENAVIGLQLAFFTDQINAHGPGRRGPRGVDEAFPQSQTRPTSSRGIPQTD